MSGSSHEEETLVAAQAEAYCGACGGSFPIEETKCPKDGTKLVHFKQRADPLLGRILDRRYRIEAQIGKGGMGAVYRARQLSVDRQVAVKIVHTSISADRNTVKRFLREARVASSLNAPGIVSVFDFGQTDDGVLYLVMELISGKTLAELTKHGPLETAKIIQIALQVADALVVAHGGGFVHRDLKPGNIIVLDTPTGEVIKVLDFGIAKTVADSTSITTTRAAVGTPVYMAPEQFEGHADARTDLYSLGCMLYELAAGHPPFDDKDFNVLYRKHRFEPPPPLPSNVPHQLVQLIERLLDKDPDERPASAAHVRTVLGELGAQSDSPIIRTAVTPRPALAAMPMPQHARPIEGEPGEREPAPRTWRRALVLGGLVATGVAVIGYRVLSTDPPPRRPVTVPAPPVSNLAPAPAVQPPPIVTPIEPAPQPPTPVAEARGSAAEADPPADEKPLPEDDVNAGPTGGAEDTVRRAKPAKRPRVLRRKPAGGKPAGGKPATDKPKTDDELPFAPTR